METEVIPIAPELAKFKPKYYTVTADGKFELRIDLLKRDFSVYLATPAYGPCPIGFTLAMQRQLRTLDACGIRKNWHCEQNNSDAALARNICAAHFLQSGMTHLMFFDSDHIWHQDDLLRMLAMDVPVLGMVYAKKVIDWKKVIKYVTRTVFKYLCSWATFREIPKDSLFGITMEELVESGLSVTGLIKKGAREHDGIIEAHRLPTGGMLIKREVFDKFIASWPSLKWELNQTEGMADLEKFLYAFFEAGLNKEKRMWTGEDYTFSDRCRDLDIPIYADLMARVCHVGTYEFSVDPRRILEQ